MAKKFGSFKASNGGAKKSSPNDMMKQAQKMQQDMAQLQEELEQQEFEVQSGGGMVTVKINGKKEIQDIVIKPEAVDPDDVEMLQDLLIVAMNEALAKVEEATEAEMGKITGGMSIPGLF